MQEAKLTFSKHLFPLHLVQQAITAYGGATLVTPVHGTPDASHLVLKVPDDQSVFEEVDVFKKILTVHAVEYWRLNAGESLQRPVPEDLTFHLAHAGLEVQVQRQEQQYKLTLVVRKDQMTWPSLLAAVGAVTGATPTIETLWPTDRYVVAFWCNARPDKLLQQLLCLLYNISPTSSPQEGAQLATTYHAETEANRVCTEF